MFAGVFVCLSKRHLSSPGARRIVGAWEVLTSALLMLGGVTSWAAPRATALFVGAVHLVTVEHANNQLVNRLERTAWDVLVTSGTSLLDARKAKEMVAGCPSRLEGRLLAQPTSKLGLYGGRVQVLVTTMHGTRPAQRFRKHASKSPIRPVSLGLMLSACGQQTRDTDADGISLPR